jgi:inhibitor of KinA sporulation pathway (predicted exonuclease)
MKMIKDFVSIDLETTGLLPKEDRIIEIAAVRFRDGKETDVYHRYLNPGRVIPERITELTGITNEMVECAPQFQDVCEEVLKFIGKSAYFTENRLENLRAEAARAGVPYEEILKETDDSDLMEGLYIKVEADGKVVDRMKYVCYGYVQSAGVADGDWLKKPIVQNKLKDGAEAF